MNKKELLAVKSFLDKELKRHNQQGFIEKDPISIPHRFSQKADIEIAGFFAAVFQKKLVPQSQSPEKGEGKETQVKTKKPAKELK